MELFSAVSAPGALAAAWRSVQQNDLDDSVVSVSIERFAADADDRLDELAARLASGRYRPKPLTELTIPKRTEGTRTLHIPAVVDRIVERAILTVVTPIVDPHLGSCAYAYRPGLGVADAVQAVVDEREAGCGWVLRTDVEECFPSIDQDAALRRLLDLLPDQSVDGLVSALASRRASTSRGMHDIVGVAQGTSLAPLYANLILVDLDDALLEAGFRPVRFADDMAVACRSDSMAKEALRVAEDAVAELGLKLGDDKTEITTFDEGFCFLGEDFGPRYPPSQPNRRTEEPVRRAVFAGVRGSRLYTKDGRLIAESKDDQELLNVPTSHVERIVCFGPVGIASGMRSWALVNDVDIVFLSAKGSYLGQQLAASAPSRVARRRRQLRYSEDEEVALPFAKAVVDAKIRHQITVVQRFGTPEKAELTRVLLHQMRQVAMLAPDANATVELMGVEGMAARTYFEALGELVPEEVWFDGRSRRPPLDVVNAALGYAYAILLGECVSALVAAGLDPDVGFLHSDEDQRPSLALDMMEEFRPYVVDQVVMNLASRRALTKEHEQRKEGVSGVLLTRAGKAALVGAYETRMLQRTKGALPGFSGTIRRHVYRQAQRIAAYVDDPTVGWSGLSWR